MSNTLAEANAMIPLTDVDLAAEWHDDEMADFGEESPRQKALFLVHDWLDIEADVSFDFGGPSAPKSPETCAEWAVEYLWDGLGWSMYENPQFVRFPNHPEWNDAEINRIIKAELEKKFEQAGRDWWDNNTQDSYF